MEAIVVAGKTHQEEKWEMEEEEKKEGLQDGHFISKERDHGACWTYLLRLAVAGANGATWGR